MDPTLANAVEKLSMAARLLEDSESKLDGIRGRLRRAFRELDALQYAVMPPFGQHADLKAHFDKLTARWGDQDLGALSDGAALGLADEIRRLNEATRRRQEGQD